MKLFRSKTMILLGFLVLASLYFKSHSNSDRTLDFQKLNNTLYEKVELNELDLLPPPTSGQLLIDVRVDNTTPSAGDVITYKFRYRYASTTEHGSNSKIQFTFPSGYNVVTLPNVGGNISNVSNSGSQYTIDLASPSSLGLGAGKLAAGSSGIFQFRVQFECGTNGSGGIPSAGTMVNFTQNPVFTVTGVSNTASAPSAVTVPTVNACTTPNNSSNYSQYHKYGDDVAGLGMYHWWSLHFPKNSPTVYTYTDIFPSEFKLWAGVHCCFNFSAGWTVEVQANGNWYNITNFQTVENFINNVSNGAVLKDQNGTNMTGTMRVDANVPNGNHNVPMITNYADGVTGIRMTGSGTHEDVYLYFYIPPTTPVGWYQNCMTTNNPAYSTDCHEVYVTDKGSLTIGCWFQDIPDGLGTTNLSSGNNNYVAGNYPSLYKDPMDIQGIIVGDHSIKTTAVEAPTYEVLLPDGFDFIEGTTKPNYWVVEESHLSAYNPASALEPVFTRTPNYNGTGRVLLEWDFPNLTFPAFGPHYLSYDKVALKVYFSTRYMGTVSLPSSGSVTANSKIRTKSVMTWTFGGAGYTGTPTQEIGCAMHYGPPTSGGSVNSEKYVQGALDTEQSRYPVSGNTETSGDATYEMYVYNHNFEKLKQIDIADILPYVGDKDMLGTTSRGSGWSEELVNAITVERYKIGTGLVSASSKIPSGILYSNTYNACYLDGALPTGQVTAVPATANTGQSTGCTDFSSAVAAAGAKGFAFQWSDAAEPLEFGEYLKISVNVTQLNGEIDVVNNEVAWNSFAYTAVEEDNDVLFSSEPLKVGVKMINQNSSATIGGRVWSDANGNGQQEAGEASFEGITVSLYDGSGNPVTTPVTIGGVTSNISVTTITDTLGNYRFYGLTPTTNYSVRLENEANFTISGSLAGLTLTTQNASGVPDTEDSDAANGTLSGSPVTARPQISLASGAAGSAIIYNDFGFYATASLGNYVWLDDDAEGDQDADEAPVQGVTMALKNVITSATIATDVTDVNGRYIFEDLAPGEYYIEATAGIPVGKTPTGKQITGNNENDSDFNNTANIETDVISLTSGEHRGDIDLGLKNQVANPATICGHTWDDFDENGRMDSGEPGQPRVTINLLDANGFVLSTTISEADGDYCFYNLEPNVTYQLAFLLPSPTGSSYTNTGSSMDASSTTGVTLITYTPASNQTITGVDCGFVGPFSIGNLVWSDVNNNGIKDNGESAYSNVTLRLYDPTINTLYATTTTDAYGKYVFTNLVEGTYRVALELPNNTSSSNDLGSTTSPNQADNDDNGIGTGNTGSIYSDNIILEMGGGANTGANWLETDHGEQINGAFDPASNPKAYYTVDFGLKSFVPEICNNGLDDDADGLIDCDDPDCYLVSNTGGVDSDGDGYDDNCDLDDDNDGILDLVECPVPTNSGLTGPMMTFTSHITSVDINSITESHILDSITLLGNIYRDLIVPDSFVSHFNFVSASAASKVEQNVNPVFTSSVSTYDQDILSAFQTRDLNIYQGLNTGEDFTDDAYDLYYNSPIISTTGGFVMVVERHGNNEHALQALDANGNLIGTQLLVQTTDYVSTGATLLYGQLAYMAIYPIDDLVPIGTEVYGIKVTFGTSATNDGPDGKVFLFGDVALAQCDYDGDGIPNNLDLDSDNDGCSDALEGVGSIASGNIIADRIGGSIDGNGVPVLAGGGQGLGASQNENTTLGCNEICNDNMDNDGDGLIDCADSDCKPDIANVAIVQPTCSNKTSGQIIITASSSGTLTYSINNTASYQASNTFNNLSVGQYTIRVKNDAGCVAEYMSNPVVMDFGTCSEICNDGIDNDGDGLIDCDDPDCDDVGRATRINNN